MPRNFRVYRHGKPHGELSSTLAIGTVNDDGTATAIVGGHSFEVDSIDRVTRACSELSSTGIDLIYDDEAG